MITITLRNIHDSNNFLILLARQPFDLDMSIDIGIALQIFEQQQKLINKALSDKAALLGFELGQSINDPPKLLKPIEKDTTVPKGLIEEFNSQVETFLDSKTVNIPIAKISKKQLLESKANTTPEMLVRLNWLFDLTSKAAKKEVTEPGQEENQRKLRLARK